MSNAGRDNRQKYQVEKIVLAFGGITSFTLTLWLALADRSAAATVTGSMTAVMLLFYFLPFFDSVEAFGLKAQLKARIGEADDLLGQLRASALVWSKINYAEIGWNSRMSGAPWDIRKVWFDELSDNLANLGLSQRAINEAKQPFLEFVTLDLYAPFDQMVGRRLNLQLKPLRDQLNATAVGQMSDSMVSKLREDIEQITKQIPAHSLVGNPNIRDFRRLVDERLQPLPLSEEEKGKLRSFGLKMALLSDVAHATGSLGEEVTAELRRIENNPHAWQSEYEELFGTA
ncbi:hypothetical protein [Sinorhizobium meliloti]|uniref:hypothetical protein n=1 Tax=Rhizobium meliloti TaxID=382 RepID=UPI0012980F3E|nr:hypothetical protein [Sinorhizobium meliloti]MQU91735.1 hypothetical protein [Sinorhizobium meliloti]MQV01785.1 hypothetical protein [Sinorhizobium meliloti]